MATHISKSQKNTESKLRRERIEQLLARTTARLEALGLTQEQIEQARQQTRQRQLENTERLLEARGLTQEQITQSRQRREQRQLELERQEEERQRRETPEYKKSVFIHQIDTQERLYRGLINGGHSYISSFVVREKKKLDQMRKDFNSFNMDLAEEKLKDMTEEEKDMLYERLQQEEQIKRRFNRDKYLRERI